ncbi:DUF6077 domain-containing protein [Traorella massiliensis]|uniref:DUF6077 domain-containing protein n=1 Tax=Traorella massiliensis TaxID=1903263 RepID=UPI002353EAE3|nr:DUF6077 domain-containing protein [Traorella massiliensis]
MVQYIAGIILTVFLAVLFQLFGICITKNKKSFSYSFIIGYIVYSFLIAIVGIPIQILNLPWKVFFFYMIFLLVGILIFISYNIYKKNVVLNKEILIDYIKENWFLYIGAILITGLALTHVQTIWENNLTDDSYYLNKIASLPYLENPFRTDYTTGLTESGISTYHLNTFELEASFYVYISGIYVTLYTRLFLALLNYFILLNALKALVIELQTKFKWKSNENLLQYIIVPIFLLIVMCSTLFITSESHWTMFSAAYYGSALVRIAALPVSLMPLINKDKLDFHAIVITIMTCVVMVSKSTVSIPVLFLATSGFLISLYKENKWYFSTFLIALILILGIILPNNEAINQNNISLIFSNVTHPFTILSLLVIGYAAISNRAYFRIACLIVTCLILILLPEVNDIFETLSNYSFVADRAIYSLFSFILIIGFITWIAILISKISKNKIITKSIGIFATFSILVSVFASGYTGSNIIDAAKIYLNNIYLVPLNTIALGEKIEQYYQESGNKVTVLMQSGIKVNSYAHFPGHILLSFAPHAISLSAGLRIADVYDNKDSEYYGFSLKELDTFTQFINDPNEITLKNIVELNEVFPFNCIVIVNSNKDHQNLLNKIGYEKYAEVLDSKLNYAYHLYIKE